MASPKSASSRPEDGVRRSARETPRETASPPQRDLLTKDEHPHASGSSCHRNEKVSPPQPSSSASAPEADAEDALSVSSVASEESTGIGEALEDAVRLGWRPPRPPPARDPCSPQLSGLRPLRPTRLSATNSRASPGLGKDLPACRARAAPGSDAAIGKMDSESPALDIDASCGFSLFDRSQQLMEAAASLEASLEAEPLLVCRINQLGVAKAIARVYPEAQWRGEVPLLTCLLSRAYARAGYEAQARYHVENAAALLDAIGLDDPQTACVGIFQQGAASVSSSARARRTLYYQLSDGHECPQKNAASNFLADHTKLAAPVPHLPTTGRDELADDLLLMEFFFSLAETLLASHAFTKAIGGFFKAIEYTNRALERANPPADGEPASVPLTPGDCMPRATEPPEVLLAVQKLELRRAELLMGVVEASLRVKEIEAIRQGNEAVEIVSRLCGGPRDVRTLQARYLTAKMLHHACRISEAFEEIKDIIRSCTLVEGESLPPQPPSGDAFPSRSSLSGAEEPDSRLPRPRSRESAETPEALESASCPRYPAFTVCLQQRVELLLNATLTAVEWIPSLPKESQADALKFCASIFYTMALQSIVNLQEREREETLSRQLGKALAGSGDSASSESSSDDEDNLAAPASGGADPPRRALFCENLVSLGRKLLSVMGTLSMEEDYTRAMDLLLDYSHLKFGADSAQYLSLLLQRSEFEAAHRDARTALLTAQSVVDTMCSRGFFLTPSEKDILQRAQTLAEALAKATKRADRGRLPSRGGWDPETGGT
ncbi:hypothetical protein BESB_031060 [Besnoitia besnoiti]|uniref:Uncharacterized protein n=1 Tax=Besnoitia besnoiti TaxID=94643 RepID=A0A2A9M783_BESBE|nr:hypothetical protein BESB_031060 [Besnoitia besnoiti]PFH31232.1 hypothetical protein BESB_031060 [Besnoitia besnoiti]